MKFSFVIPTLNEEKRLPRALSSIRDSIFDQSQIEILVIDGGSSDQTCMVAQQFGAVVITNPHRQQEYAKFIGLCAARGEFVVFLDADEVLVDREGLSKRLDLFATSPELGIVLWSGYRLPKHTHWINAYINHFSDPFAYFIYKPCSEEMQVAKWWDARHTRVVAAASGTVFKVNSRASLPLADICAGCTIRRSVVDKIREELGDNVAIVPQLFYLIVSTTGLAAVLTNSPTEHNSAESLSTFINKLNWRVKANIYHKSHPGTGFANRRHFQSRSTKWRTYFFIPYAMLILPATVIGFAHALRYRRVGFAAHGPLTFYVGLLIMFHMAMKVLGQTRSLGDYGKTTQVGN